MVNDDPDRTKPNFPPIHSSAKLTRIFRKWLFMRHICACIRSHHTFWIGSEFFADEDIRQHPARATGPAWASSRSCQDCCSLCFLVIMLCIAHYAARGCKDPPPASQGPVSMYPCSSRSLPTWWLTKSRSSCLGTWNSVRTDDARSVGALGSTAWRRTSACCIPRNKRVDLAHGGMRTGGFVSSYSGSDLLIISFLVAGTLRSYDSELTRIFIGIQWGMNGIEQFGDLYLD